MNLSEVNQKLKCVAVTKGRSVDEIKSMIEQTGFKRIAENRLHEAEMKFPHLPDLEKHFIGKLQSRKIAKIVKLFDVIQSVENLQQANSINKQSSEHGKKMKILLQVKLDGSPKRSGCSVSEAPELITKIKEMKNIQLIGIMGIASQDLTHTRKQFKLLKSLQGNLSECSMGMSNDYEIAISEGSTMLRLGRILFDESTLNLPDGVELE